MRRWLLPLLILLLGVLLMTGLTLMLSPAGAQTPTRRFLVTTYTETVVSYVWLSEPELRDVRALLDRMQERAPYAYDGVAVGSAWMTVTVYHAEPTGR